MTGFSAQFWRLFAAIAFLTVLLPGLPAEARLGAALSGTASCDADACLTAETTAAIRGTLLSAGKPDPKPLPHRGPDPVLPATAVEVVRACGTPAPDPPVADGVTRVVTAAAPRGPPSRA